MIPVQHMPAVNDEKGMPRFRLIDKPTHFINDARDLLGVVLVSDACNVGQKRQ